MENQKKPTINPPVNPSPAPPAGGPLDIHVMPKRFMTASGASRKAKITGLIIIVSVLGVALAATAFYLNYALQNSKNQAPANTNQVSQKNANTNQTNQNRANQNANTNANRNANTNQNEAVNDNTSINADINPPTGGLSAGLDSDDDGLTDEEEGLYSAEINNADTDGDSYLDGAEVANLYNPAGSGQIIGLSTIDVFTSSAFDYSILYPIDWTLEVTESAGQEVMFTSQTGEFVKIFVQDNPEQISALAWYLAQWPDLTASQLKSIEVNGLAGVWGLDDLTVYLAKADQLYVIAYNVGERPTANFQATFQMMIKSFELKD